MELNQNNINSFLEKYITLNDKICDKYNYHTNIKHLLYLIIPAFVIKYGVKEEKTILDVFMNTEIIITNETMGNVYALFERRLIKEDNNYYTKKNIKVFYFEKASLVNLLDSLIHEFNHSINSINNEIKVLDNKVYVRTGLSYTCYEEEGKQANVVLEEVLNIKETEQIMDIINSFGNYEINNEEFSNFLYSLKNEINGKYNSNAYGYITSLCKDLINNKTFINTITNLRYRGLVDDIESWFDTIAGVGSYNKFNKYLIDILNIDRSLSNAKWYNKNSKINKAHKISRDVSDIISEFNKNTIYK